MCNEMSPDAPAPSLSRWVDTPAPPYGSPGSCPRISASSRLTSLCFWPPLCCQILFSHITPRHRFNYPKKSNHTECLILWVLLKNWREEEVSYREGQVLQHSALPLLSSFSFLSLSRTMSKLNLPRLPEPY